MKLLLIDLFHLFSCLQDIHDSKKVQSSQLTAALAQVRLSVTELSAGQSKISTLQSELSSSQTRADFVVKENEALNLEMGKLIDRLTELHQAKTTLEHRVVGLTDEDARKTSQISELTQQINQVTESENNTKIYHCQQKLIKTSKQTITKDVTHDENHFNEKEEYLQVRLKQMTSKQAELIAQLTQLKKENNEHLQSMESKIVLKECDLLKEKVFLLEQRLIDTVQLKKERDELKRNIFELEKKFSEISELNGDLRLRLVKLSARLQEGLMEADMGDVGIVEQKESQEKIKKVVEKYRKKVREERMKVAALESKLTALKNSLAYASECNRQWQEAFAVLNRTYQVFHQIISQPFFSRYSIVNGFFEIVVQGARLLLFSTIDLRRTSKEILHNGIWFG